MQIKIILKNSLEIAHVTGQENIVSLLSKHYRFDNDRKIRNGNIEFSRIEKFDNRKLFCFEQRNRRRRFTKNR